MRDYPSLSPSFSGSAVTTAASLCILRTQNRSFQEASENQPTQNVGQATATEIVKICRVSCGKIVGQQCRVFAAAPDASRASYRARRLFCIVLWDTTGESHACVGVCDAHPCRPKIYSSKETKSAIPPPPRAQEVNSSSSELSFLKGEICRWRQEDGRNERVSEWHDRLMRVTEGASRVARACRWEVHAYQL